MRHFTTVILHGQLLKYELKIFGTDSLIFDIGTPSLPNAIMLKIHEIKSFFTAPSKVHDVTEVIAVCQNNGLKFGKNMQTIDRDILSFPTFFFDHCILI